jgi:hypothetical protein
MRSLPLSAVTIATAVLLLPGVAAASCAEPPPLARHLGQADVVFVGTVVNLRNDDRAATFAVSEVWSGPELPAMVTVHGGPDEPGLMTSVDRSYQGGVKYLVAASLVDGTITDNTCSATRAWDESLAALRPAEARPPIETAASSDPDSLPAVPLAMAALVALFAVGSVLAFRIRS